MRPTVCFIDPSESLFPLTFDDKREPHAGHHNNEAGKEREPPALIEERLAIMDELAPTDPVGIAETQIADIYAFWLDPRIAPERRRA